MRESLDSQLAALEAQMAALQARKQALQAAATGTWPKRLTLYTHCSKDTNWSKGEALGLTGEALRLFVHFEEIALDVAVAEDGSVTILACDGKPLQR